MVALLWFQTMRYYCPNLLFFKQRTTETVSKVFYSFVYLPKDLKMRLLISSAYHEGIKGVYLLTKYGPKK